MFAFAAVLAARVPAVAVLANGGMISKKEVLSAVRHGITTVVIEGSGRLADQIARALHKDGEVDGAEYGQPRLRVAREADRDIARHAVGLGGEPVLLERRRKVWMRPRRAVKGDALVDAHLARRALKLREDGVVVREPDEELARRLRLDPIARETLGQQLGGVIAGAHARKVPCPRCSEPSVWWMINGTGYANCSHLKTCGWLGPLTSLLG
jgi:hypothetical protein